MCPCQIVTHQQKKIVLVDLTGCKEEQILSTLREAQKVIAGFSPKSALVLTNVKNTTYNSAVSNAIKAFTEHNTPYVKASAVTGADGLRKVLLQTVVMLTRREIHSFDTEEEALNWLVAQP